MIRFISPSKLRALGMLGMNERNIGFIGEHNPRRNYPLVDDKLKTKATALEHNIRVPQLYGVIKYQFEIAAATRRLHEHDGFVIKPAQGSGGKGILVVTGHENGLFIKSSGAAIDASEVRRHISNILAGLYSLGGRNDKAMVEALIQFDPDMEKYSCEGVPDIRVIAFKGVPVMAMMRCATHESDGKANLHQGAVGVGIDIASGRAIRAVQHGHLITQHPDTGASFDDLQIPHWLQILDLSSRCVAMTGLGYLGVDIVLDKLRGPMLLELNARPGLAIQVANMAGLLHRLEAADKIASQTDNHEEKIALARQQFAARLITAYPRNQIDTGG
ncbi:MAG: alpha-L-glutamate ligase-like protein [Pseudomonadota bacterium]